MCSDISWRPTFGKIDGTSLRCQRTQAAELRYSTFLSQRYLLDGVRTRYSSSRSGVSDRTFQDQERSGTWPYIGFSMRVGGGDPPHLRCWSGQLARAVCCGRLMQVRRDSAGGFTRGMRAAERPRCAVHGGLSGEVLRHTIDNSTFCLRTHWKVSRMAGRGGTCPASRWSRTPPTGSGQRRPVHHRVKDQRGVRRRLRL